MGIDTELIPNPQQPGGKSRQAKVWGLDLEFRTASACLYSLFRMLVKSGSSNSENELEGFLFPVGVSMVEGITSPQARTRTELQLHW